MARAWRGVEGLEAEAVGAALAAREPRVLLQGERERERER